MPESSDLCPCTAYKAAGRYTRVMTPRDDRDGREERERENMGVKAR